MSTLPKEEPRLLKGLSAVQKRLAGIAVTMALVVWVCSFDIIKELFNKKNDWILGGFRIILALIGLGITSVVGVDQVLFMLESAGKMYGKLKKIKDETVE